MSFGEKLKQARKNKHLTQKQLAEKIGAKHNSVSNWENNQNKPDPDTIELICGVLDINPNFLFEINGDKKDDFGISSLAKYGVMPIKTQKIPLLGSISCGVAKYAEEEFEGYIEASSDIKADFCIRADGDSMIGARILDGDVIFIRKQEMVDNGEIAAVIIDDNATLKRVYYDQENNVLTLIAENPRVPPQIFQGEQLNQIHILGKAVAFQSYVK